MDGFGRTLVAFAEADETHDGSKWVAGGVVEYDAKAAVRRKFLPFFFNSEPENYNLADAPNAQYGSQRYDAFGRAVQTYDVDGTVTLTTRYHALSTDLYDAADIGPGLHTGSYASTQQDGHGRGILSTERFHTGGKLEKRYVKTTYLPTGEVAVIERYKSGAASDRVTRWMRYDSLGRMVLNVDPNTTVEFTADSNADVSAGGMKAWRYSYNDAGDLVGTSDARGCGVNFAYDGAGRLLSEDYSPCESHHALYSDPETKGLDGAEVIYSYDTSAPPGGLEAPPELTVVNNSFYAGQLAAVWDRGAVRYTSYDGRGRAIETHAKIAAPKSQTTGTLADRYAPRWYKREVRYDAADREIWSTTGARHQELMAVPTAPGHGISGGSASASAVTTSYTRRGKTKSVGGSYGALVQSVAHTADDRVTRIVYGDLAATATDFSYDFRRRLMTVQTYRGPPSAWSDPDAYRPAPAPGAEPSTFQLLLQDQEYEYDSVNNPTEITDYRIPDEWPESAKPVTRKMQYDDLYRVERVDYEYAAGDDVWKSPFDAENEATSGIGGDDIDPRRAKPSPHVRFDKRTLWQTFEYDWLGNNKVTKDDANGFYDRSLGEIENGDVKGAAYRMLGAASESPRVTESGASTDWLDVQYDASGSMRAVTVSRGGECLGAQGLDGCSQHYVYEWDEVGRLSRARRWDATVDDIGAYGTATANPNADADTYAGLADVELGYIYDGSDQRVIKTAIDADNNESHSAYIFASLELRRAQYTTALGEAAPDYERSALTEVAYLFAGGVRLARVVFEPADVPSLDDDAAGEKYGRGSKLHVFFELGDHLGSSSLVLDQQTSELVEATTYQAYGATESDYRPDRWANFREDYRFTGKEEDVEVGLQFFGKRYLNPLLGRWVSADPLAVHVPGEADFNLYAYVSGRALQLVDPLGLQSEGIAAASASGDMAQVNTSASNSSMNAVMTELDTMTNAQLDALLANEEASFRVRYAARTVRDRQLPGAALRFAAMVTREVTVPERLQAAQFIAGYITGERGTTTRPAIRFNHADAAMHIAHVLVAAANGGVRDKSQISYMISTADHESMMGQRMRESEAFAATRNYSGGVDFRGAGYAHLTHDTNFRKFGVFDDPASAATPSVAARILVEGMTSVGFRSRRLVLSAFGADGSFDFDGARAIVNTTEERHENAHREAGRIRAANSIRHEREVVAPAAGRAGRAIRRRMNRP